MAERTVPISKRQSELIDGLSKQRQTLDLQINVAITTLLAATDDAIPPTVQWRTVVIGDVYTLVVTVPDPPADSDTPKPVLSVVRDGAEESA